ncbi:MAG: hypothetical protein KGL18_17330 [Burkholderiales bacterium]|nr:hypothetical protein [Burkholderiales bacterium]MDE1927452.1 hypothetical protein [Burkholderiales bacterium]MDE2504730.1 hypothetical protein [Burkholderiales bacterium]
MNPRKILRVVLVLVLAALIFGCEVEFVAPWLGHAIDAWAYRSGAQTTAMRVWFAPVLIGLAALAVFAVVALWVALVLARRLLPATAAPGERARR